MPLTFISSQDIPKKGSLIVCAGTVTCQTVSQMGAGFSVFKRYFADDTAYDKNKSGWQAALNETLKAYFQDKTPMPPFQLIAKSDDYLGGVATVPCLSAHIGLDPNRHNSNLNDLEQDYLNAVKGAIDKARELSIPLYLQPLGIGVYGWAGEKGAALFAKAIQENNADDKVAITIPLFNMSPQSNDQLFKTALVQWLSAPS